MRKLKPFSLPIWTLVIILCTVNVIVFAVLLMSSPEDLIVQYVPDDAYYYLTLSRNFASYGSWTFDSGVSVTSGFHPLFAYLLAITYLLLKPDTQNFVIYSLILSLTFSLASIAILWAWGSKTKNILFLMFVALVVTSINFVYNSISITEWSLTVFIASLYCVWFFTKSQNPEIKSTDLFVFFLLGLSGSIARTDFGLLPFSIAAAALIPFPGTTKKKWPFALAGLMGALTGLLAIFVHNFIFTGEILQSSARMKDYWSQLGTPIYYIVPFLIGRIIGLIGLILFALLIITAVLPKFFKRQDTSSIASEPASKFFSAQHGQPEDRDSRLQNNSHSLKLMILSAGICFLGYTLVYSRNVAIQPWYTANLVVPTLILIFATSDYLALSLGTKAKFLFVLLFLATLISNLADLYPISTVNARWPHQKLMFQAGVYLRENPQECRIGGWNAGIIGYYEGGHIINLDGLVNNDIYPYAIENNLPDYISSQDICYIIDFEDMLTSSSLRTRGGYDDPRFISELIPKMVFDGGELGILTLYQVQPTNR